MELSHDPHEYNQKHLFIACVALSPGGHFFAFIKPTYK